MPYVAGNDIHAHCPKCDRDLEHTVIEAHSGIVQLVRCKTCSSSHPYQRPHVPAKAKAKPKKASGRKRAARGGAPKPTPWEELMEARDPAAARPYGIRELFAQDDLVAHTKFGIGIVTAVLEGGKVEVAFQEGVKKLVHDRG